jgi:hypothetical protein
MASLIPGLIRFVRDYRTVCNTYSIQNVEQLFDTSDRRRKIVKEKGLISVPESPNYHSLPSILFIPFPCHKPTQLVHCISVDSALADSFTEEGESMVHSVFYMYRRTSSVSHEGGTLFISHSNCHVFMLHLQIHFGSESTTVPSDSHS